MIPRRWVLAVILLLPSSSFIDLTRETMQSSSVKEENKFQNCSSKCCLKIYFLSRFLKLNRQRQNSLSHLKIMRFDGLTWEKYALITYQYNRVLPSKSTNCVSPSSLKFFFHYWIRSFRLSPRSLKKRSPSTSRASGWARRGQRRAWVELVVLPSLAVNTFFIIWYMSEKTKKDL